MVSALDRQREVRVNLAATADDTIGPRRRSVSSVARPLASACTARFQAVRRIKVEGSFLEANAVLRANVVQQPATPKRLSSVHFIQVDQAGQLKSREGAASR